MRLYFDVNYKVYFDIRTFHKTFIKSIKIVP